MIKLPFRWNLFIQLFRSPAVIEEYWSKTPKETDELIKRLKAKYADQPNVYVKAQYFIQNNQDRIMVFKHNHGEKEATK